MFPVPSPRKLKDKTLKINTTSHQHNGGTGLLIVNELEVDMISFSNVTKSSGIQSACIPRL